MPLKGKRVFVVGVGMTNFTKPKKDPGEGPHYPGEQRWYTSHDMTG